MKNEAGTIGACVDGILAQTHPPDEIIVVDSGSTDATLKILRTYPSVRLVQIEPADFNHGEARNIGVREARSEWVLLTVGDARPADAEWIEKLFAGVTGDSVVAVCGSQVVPHSRETNPVDWFRPMSEPELRHVSFGSAAEFDSLGPEAKSSACGWDDVTALYRRDMLLKLPFEQVMYGEDAIWAKAALRAGFTLVYNPAARVYHYHNEHPDFTFRRTLLTLCFRYQRFGVVHGCPPLGKTMLRVAHRLASESAITWTDRIRWLRYNWNTQRASRRAHDVFNSALGENLRALDSLCDSCSDRPPIPTKFSQGEIA